MAAKRMAAILGPDQGDVALDAAVDEAMRGISESDLSGETMPTPSVNEPTVGALCTGRVANVGSEDMLVDFGTKLLGVMPRAELEKDETYQIGDPIEVIITGEDVQGGVLNVSRRKAKQAAILRDLKVGLVLEGQVTGMNRGGLEVSIEGLRAFIPASQVDLHFMKDISDLIGSTVRC
ncbi:MAG: S1 RNA-binding domain-containing protein, partial [Phycisphaerae bacterium]